MMDARLNEDIREWGGRYLARMFYRNVMNHLKEIEFWESIDG